MSSTAGGSEDDVDGAEPGGTAGSTVAAGGGLAGMGAPTLDASADRSDEPSAHARQEIIAAAEARDRMFKGSPSNRVGTAPKRNSGDSLGE